MGLGSNSSQVALPRRIRHGFWPLSFSARCSTCTRALDAHQLDRLNLRGVTRFSMDEDEREVGRAAARTVLAGLVGRSDVAAFVGLTPRALKFYLFRLKSSRRYVKFELRKRAGGVREIRAPIPPIKRAQKLIAEHLAAFYEPRRSVYGYIPGRSIVGNATCHSAKRWVLRVDLQDFFPSINFGRVRGLLLAAPFSLPPEAATTIAQLCVDENQLPQGSPASPIISNIVCRGLDKALAELARTHRCSYTRYCDDIVFSTNRASFPRSLAHLEEAGEGRTTAVIGDALLQAITQAGFRVNEAKTQLRPKSQCQMVTGLVTNLRVNVPRKFVLEVRQLLHAWGKLGTIGASDWFFAKHDKRNRPAGKKRPEFEMVVRGKVQHIGSVKGWGDPIYRRFSKQLQALDPRFRPHANSLLHAHVELHVFTEGKTGADPVSRTPDGASKLPESGTWQNSERSTRKNSSGTRCG